MIKVTVASTDIRDFKGIGKASGKPFHMRMQTVWCHLTDKQGNLNPFPEKTEIKLDADERDNVTPYALGEYQLHPASLFMGQYGLEVAPKLVPLKKAA